MDVIKDIIQKVIGDISSKQPKNRHNIQKDWDRILSEKELGHCKIFDIKDDQLLVHVDSSAWMFQFNLKKKTILEQLQKEHPDIKKIYFKIGKVQ